MKLLIIALFIGLSACSSGLGHPKFHKGDCYALNDIEKWQLKDAVFYKVLEVGHDHYRIAYYIPAISESVREDTSFFSTDENRFKVDCPKTLEQY
jgi:hypothetical protein